MASGSEQRVTWRDVDGEPLSCTEKIKVLEENLAEIRDLAIEAFEDAVLMGCDPAQYRQVLRDLVDGLDEPYKK
jgi:hypothetical protein